MKKFAGIIMAIVVAVFTFHSAQAQTGIVQKFFGSSTTQKQDVKRIVTPKQTAPANISSNAPVGVHVLPDYMGMIEQAREEFWANVEIPESCLAEFDEMNIRGRVAYDIRQPINPAQYYILPWVRATYVVLNDNTGYVWQEGRDGTFAHFSTNFWVPMPDTSIVNKSCTFDAFQSNPQNCFSETGGDIQSQMIGFFTVEYRYLVPDTSTALNHAEQVRRACGGIAELIIR